MRWVVLVALLLVGLGAYSLLSSAHEMGMAVMADANEQTGATAPRLLEREVRVRGEMAMLDLVCPAAGGCRGVMTIELGEKVGSAPYALPGARTMRYALPLPPGSRAERAKLSWQEDSGASGHAEIELKRG
ncbi:hypothetical protein DVA67_016665 [Solirubrobacter sp. CPCC 204708]|uniref:Uncharacterized protein n=1 Tax=Solirubrobacter deserti TaxID=2282478 RepID=A0ABT4RJ36_9ACTN|nr:hypothetical protein [Solirubrobacter deserti]MBE2317617.1 hypothetical protein [Solirubrobacter deserti]MDA0138566.1 hypothetical protein [Solirubrobacter deserti]